MTETRWMPRVPMLVALVATMLGCSVAHQALAQNPVVIRGRVTAPDSTAVRGATIIALSLPDSATHRTHVAFPDPATGACPAGTVAIPRLRITLGYRVPPGRSYAIDSFPDQQRRALTDHFDFLNVMSEPLMREAVDCLNTGRTC